MALNVISNFAANVAHRHLTETDMKMTDSLAKLSAGTRVLSAKDDAASMAIGSRLAAEVNALTQARVNSGQAVSMLQVADGAMARANDILLRMKTLAVQAGSGQLSGTERGMLDTEYQQLVSEIDRLAEDTEFNGVTLVNGALALDITTAATAFALSEGVTSIIPRGSFDIVAAPTAALTYTTTGDFQLIHNGSTYAGSIAADSNNGTDMTNGTVVTLSTGGSDTNKIDIALNTAFDLDAAHAAGTITFSGASQTSFTYKVGTGTSSTADEITVSLSGTSATALGLSATDITDATTADTASTLITNAIDQLNITRATIGASLNRLEFAAANIATTLENTEAARSNLLDLDIAAEMSNFTSKQILQQAGVAMLAQANETPQTLLRLFQ
ncbi:MAG: flagellin [Paracoccaceae bacterium]|jgi:flagellin